MATGYSFSNKNVTENDVKVLGENNPQVITFSKALILPISKNCRNNCPYCGFTKKDSLAVPYSTIKAAKEARQEGAREIVYVAGERPDKFPHIRSVLDLWGFHSYLDYLYTICELGFLEGLIPVLDIGFLAPNEMQKLSEISATFNIMLDFVSKNNRHKIFKNSPGKRLEIRLKSLSWAGKLNINVSTGLIIGLEETIEQRRDALQEIAKIHQEYGNIHEVLLQNFVPEPKTEYSNHQPPTKETMLKTTQLALEILPSDIKVIVPIEFNPDIEDFIKAGIKDLGRITCSPRPYLSNYIQTDINKLAQKLETLGYSLQQRFPLSMNYIQEGKYSKKLGQVFDAYKYKIKKEEQEKIKDAKINAYENKK